MSDPHTRVFNNKVYLYSGHDSSPTDPLWVMKDWRVFSSTDLIHWELETTVSPEDNYMPDDSTDCWAADAATRNGRYYFYFSDRKRSVGVMSASSPGGPFSDALGAPLVAPGFDPTVFTDDDSNQTPYIIFGNKPQGYQIARFNDDMISLAEAPKTIQIIGPEWEQAPAWMDKNYLFKRNSIYYLSWGTDYATSSNIYGPYQCMGRTGQGFDLGPFAHGSFFEWKGQFYHVWCYYIDSRYKYRETVMTYCHFDDDGNIVDDIGFLQQHFATGMGKYNAGWPKIEAEWFYEKSPELGKQECAEGGFEITGIQNGSWLRFAKLDFGAGMNSFEARVSSSGPNARIEVRRDSPTGPLLGTLTVADSGGPSAYRTFTGSLQGAVGIYDVYLKFSTGTETLMRLNWLRFTTAGLAFNADAGPDQSLIDFDSDGIEGVTLNGSALSEGAITITNYQWTLFGTPLATGPNPEISLGIGTHVISLLVTDSMGATATDTLVVTVSPFLGLSKAVIFGDLSDSAPRSDRTILGATASDSNLFVGRAGTPPGLDRSPVLVFQLPDLGSVAAPFASASFSLNYASNHLSTPPTANVDLYGLGMRATATVLGGDYHGETNIPDPSDAVLLQNGFLHTAMVSEDTGYGVKTTSIEGNAALANYLNAQYATAEGRLKYVFLRLSSDAAMPLNVRYVITSGNGANNAEDQEIWPQIGFSAVIPYPDTDEDGLPDQWEMQNFKTLAMSGSGDEDGDGKSNLEEFVAGTDPNDSRSRFKVTSVTPDDRGESTIRWDSVNGRIYTVYKSTDLTTNSWISVSPPQPGTGAEMIYHAKAGGLRKFYRVGVGFIKTGEGFEITGPWAKPSHSEF